MEQNSNPPPSSPSFTPSFLTTPSSSKQSYLPQLSNNPFATLNTQYEENSPTQNYSDGLKNEDPFADLDYLVTHIVQCDDFFCPELASMHMDSILLAIHIKYPEIQHDIEVCDAEHGMDSKPCQSLLIEAINRVNPMLYDLIDQKRRAVSPDPLINYDGLQYLSPFWFQGAGDIWRKIDGRSKRTSIADCHRLKRTLDECLALPENKRTNHCFKEYSHSKMCAPGINCPYIRLPMTQCIFNEHITDYRAVDHCFASIPRFTRCQDGFVPHDAAV